MKALIFSLFIIFCISNDTNAQSGEPDCRIWYQYDATGQRVKRFYQCKSDDEMQTDRTIKATLFPNPTDGPIIVVTDLTVDELSVNVFNINGSFVTSSNCLDCSSISLNIGGQLTGTYMVQIVATKQNYTTLNESHAVIKHD